MIKLLILSTLIFAGCRTPNPVHLQNYLNHVQAQQHHMDRMKQNHRLPMRQVAPKRIRNPYRPSNGYTPYNPMRGY